MKRRGFLQALLAAPAIPYVPAAPPVVPVDRVMPTYLQAVAPDTGRLFNRVGAFGGSYAWNDTMPANGKSGLR